MAFVPVYILILAFTITVDYFAAIWMESSQGKKRRYLLIASIVVNIGTLALFKYFNFFNENLTTILDQSGLHNPVPYLNLLLPIGLSFHTLQSLSYTIEVYRGNQKAERHFGILALYVMFFPQLVAGPIERPQNLIHQFRKKHPFNYEMVVCGLRQMLWGFFMKLVVADRLAIYVDAVYNNPRHHTGGSLGLATIFFSFQIYCDFAGYSNIAIGAARVLGIDLMTNFNIPFSAKSITEFWRRWHISLSSWFRDYLYVPLGGNREGITRFYLNIFIVFLLSGIWHGAGWLFIVWGALHGFYLVFARITQQWRAQLSRFLGITNYPVIHGMLQMGTVFLLVGFSWIFFRATNLEDAFLIAGKVLKSPFSKVFIPSLPIFIYSIIALAVLIFHEVISYRKKTELFWFAQPNRVLRWGAYISIVMLILTMGVFDGSQFIYFQF